MYKYSKVSIERLSTCDNDLQLLFTAVLQLMDNSIICGHRGETAQNKAFDDKKSMVKWPNSKHNPSPSRAVDVVPYPSMWDSHEHFYLLAGFVKATAKRLDIKVRWGGDWDGDNDVHDQTFNDLAHWELIS